MSQDPNQHGTALVCSAVVTLVIWAWTASFMEHVMPRGWWVAPAHITLLFVMLFVWGTLALWIGKNIDDDK